jgi:hypothetical protein
MKAPMPRLKILVRRSNITLERELQKPKQFSEILSTDAGMQIDLSDLQSPKTRSSRLSNVAPRANVTANILPHPLKQDLEMTLTDDGMPIDASSEQEENADSAKAETRLPKPKVTLVSSLQSEKQDSPMLSTEEGMHIVLSDSHPRNAHAPKREHWLPPSNVTTDSRMQPEKQRLSIRSIPDGAQICAGEAFSPRPSSSQSKDERGIANPDADTKLRGKRESHDQRQQFHVLNTGVSSGPLRTTQWADGAESRPDGALLGGRVREPEANSGRICGNTAGPDRIETGLKSTVGPFSRGSAGLAAGGAGRGWNGLGGR